MWLLDVNDSNSTEVYWTWEAGSQELDEVGIYAPNNTGKIFINLFIFYFNIIQLVTLMLLYTLVVEMKELHGSLLMANCGFLEEEAQIPEEYILIVSYCLNSVVKFFLAVLGDLWSFDTSNYQWTFYGGVIDELDEADYNSTVWPFSRSLSHSWVYNQQLCMFGGSFHYRDSKNF